MGGKPIIYNKFSGLQEPIKSNVGTKVEDYIDDQRKWKQLSTLDIPNRKDLFVKDLEEMMCHHTLPIHAQWDEVIWDRRTNGRFSVGFV